MKKIITKIALLSMVIVISSDIFAFSFNQTKKVEAKELERIIKVI